MATLKKHLGVRVSPELHEKIRRAASREGRSASVWIRRLARQRAEQTIEDENDAEAD